MSNHIYTGDGIWLDNLEKRELLELLIQEVDINTTEETDNEN